MPELPEVETIRRQLAPALEGAPARALRGPGPALVRARAARGARDALEGRAIERLGRRGKYLISSLEDDVHLVMHLRMTGNLLLSRRGRRSRPHTARACSSSTRATAPVRGRAPLRHRRRAARRATRSTTTSHSRLGVEPLSPDFTAEALRALARGRKQPVKAFLLNQERVAGVGNIYADEALFRARIHPLRPVGTLKRRPDRGPARRRGGGARAGDRLEGRLDRRLPPHRRRAREPSRTASWCTCARASPARAAARRSRSCARPAGAPTSARAASGGRGVRRARRSRLGVSSSSSMPARSASTSSRKPPIGALSHHHLRERHLAR